MTTIIVRIGCKWYEKSSLAGNLQEKWNSRVFFGPIVIQEQSIYFAMHFMSIECSIGWLADIILIDPKWHINVVLHTKCIMHITIGKDWLTNFFQKNWTFSCKEEICNKLVAFQFLRLQK